MPRPPALRLELRVASVAAPVWRHGRLVTMLTVALMDQVPAEAAVGCEMTIKLD